MVRCVPVRQRAVMQARRGKLMYVPVWSGRHGEVR
jgi:hypothetical protein